MSQPQYSFLPGDQGLVEHIIGELKSKGIFDQFRKECIADVDTRPAYQNLRLRVEGSVSGFLSHQRWRPDLNKNGLREKLRKHIHEANYLEQGVERIVDQVVNPKVASVFVPQVEDLVYSYLGIERPKLAVNSNNSYTNTSNYVNEESLLPTDLEAVSPDSVKSQELDSKEEKAEILEVENPTDDDKMEVCSEEVKPENDDEFQSPEFEPIEKAKNESTLDTQLSGISDLTSHESNDSHSKVIFSLQTDIKPDEIKAEESNVSSVLVKCPSLSKLSIDIPLPGEPPKTEIFHEESVNTELKPSSDAESSSDSTMMRNVSPLTPIRSYNNENSCDAQPCFNERQSATGNLENNNDVSEIPIPISTFRFAIESKDSSDSNASPSELKAPEQVNDDKTTLSYQFENQINLNNYGGPSYDDSSCSNNLHIDYQSDHNGGAAIDSRMEQDSKMETATILSYDERSKSKEQSYEEKRGSHKSSRSSRDSRQHSSSRHSKEQRLASKHPTSSSDRKDSYKSDKKSSKDGTHSSKPRHSSQTEKSKDRSEKKDKERTESSKDKHGSSHRSSSSSHRDSKSKHHSSSSSRRHSSTSGSKQVDEKKSSSTNRDKGDSKKDDTKEYRSSSKHASRDSSKQSSSHRSDKDKTKCSTETQSKKKDKHDKDVKKDDKKDKKVTDDHYSASGRGNRIRRSTDRDSNDGNSSSSKGSTFMNSAKTADNAAGEKSTSSKSENNSCGSDSTGQSDNIEQPYTECEYECIIRDDSNAAKSSLKPVIVLDSHLNTPVVEAPQLPPVQVASIRKPMIAANMNEAMKLMKIRKSIAAEQEKKRQEAALLIEFQEKIHSSISQVYSGVSGPELEFVCHTSKNGGATVVNDDIVEIDTSIVTSEEQCDPIENSFDESSNLNHVINEINESEPNNNEEDRDQKRDSYNGNDINNEENLESTDKIKHDQQDDEFLNFLCGSPNEEMDLNYFGQHEIYKAELERDKFSTFYASLDKVETKKKIFLLNCDQFEQDVITQVYKEIGDYKVVNYCQKQQHVPPKNGLNKLNTQDLTQSNEIVLPVGVNKLQPSTLLSESCIYQDPENSSSESTYTFTPDLTSECSMESSVDYDKNIDDMISKTSRQQIMEIIFGSAINDSPSKLPKVVFSDHRTDDEQMSKPNLKRKRNGLTEELGGAEKNNHKVLLPNKIRRLSVSEQISSTTEGEINGINDAATKSKLTGRARRVGLPKPRNMTSAITSSPSSDKSVENYEQSSPVKRSSPPLNGASAGVEGVLGKSVRRHKLQQRYDTSDLYKPKLHYLSKRHSHVT